KRFGLDYAAGDIFITSFDIDNAGNQFFLLDYPKGLKKRKDSDPRLFFLYSYFYEGDKMLEFELGENDKYIEELGMAVNNFSKKVSVAGFYSFNNDNKVNGYFYFMLDISSAAVGIKKYDSIDASALLHVSSRLSRKTDLSDLYIRKIV